MFQENKARQIFWKTNISYPLIRTRTSFCLFALLSTSIACWVATFASGCFDSSNWSVSSVRGRIPPLILLMNTLRAPLTLLFCICRIYFLLHLLLRCFDYIIWSFIWFQPILNCFSLFEKWSLDLEFLFGFCNSTVFKAISLIGVS